MAKWSQCTTPKNNWLVCHSESLQECVSELINVELFRPDENFDVA